MKSMKKKVAALVAVAMIFGCVIGGSLAWLIADPVTVTNTFSDSNIAITLDEADTNENGQFLNASGDVVTNISDAKRVADNTYKMVPGYTYPKDPTVTVEAKSEACLLFVKVKEANMALASDNSKEYLTYSIDKETVTSGDTWHELEGVANVYYREVPASESNQMFTILTGNQVKVNEAVTKADMAAADSTNPKLTFTACAVQLMKDNTTEFTVTEAWDNVPNAFKNA